ncbi:hypothetical protein Bhyg_13779 [Pseudolycoriella hygida]|uniref:Uncharacterized protein n=1 Tax=Pseudolycoriella hygida TaxID=35572 RepID=A0A9Q0MNH9_9DIPT|nr:hypothetical protein Bhyg_13779 [Pseudolycoriella hygida]
MEAAIRSVQVGPPGQRADTQPPPTISYQTRIPSGASPIHREMLAVENLCPKIMC